MLFKQDTLKDIKQGRVTVAFRRWRRPTVRAGGTLTTPVGVLAIDAVDRIPLSSLTAADARAAGYADAASLKAALTKRRDGSVYRVEFRLGGPDPRIALRSRARLTAEETRDLKARLDKWDRAIGDGPWTRQYLALLNLSSGIRAADLAAKVGLDTQRFKTRVRKLKGLGLTESLEVGYRLSPRGKALLTILS